MIYFLLRSVCCALCLFTLCGSVAFCEEPAPCPSVSAPSKLRLLFTGDIIVHQEQLNAAYDTTTKQHDFAPQFASIRPFLRDGILIGNFETVLAGAQRGYTGYPAFNSPDSLAAALKDAGFDILTLANNHIYDKGAAGARRTLSVLQTHGFLTCGLYADAPPEPLILEENGIRVGIINYTYGSNNPADYRAQKLTLNIVYADWDHGKKRAQLKAEAQTRITEDVRKLREQGVSFIVALFHWGLEYTPEPTLVQKEIAQFCLELGIQVIIGTHPHVAQGLALTEKAGEMRLIAWSLGNFISYQRTFPRDRAFILALDLEQDPNPSSPPAAVSRPRIRAVRVLPTYVENTRRPQGRQIRVLPALARPQEADESQLQKKLNRANADILEKLHYSGIPDKEGFYPFFVR